MTLFVGQNDAGKSNILRALNLFFNGQTNHQTDFSFEDDHSALNKLEKNAKKAKEIEITVELELPETYRKKNGDRIVWKKTWRNHGLQYDSYHGIRLHNNKNVKLKNPKKMDIPPKSNAHSLLRHIEFVYVPAIKDNHYFDSLRGKIYHLIADIAAKSFKESSLNFEKSIATHLGDLMNNIKTTIGLDSKLALPKDLSHIFERLDFLSEFDQFTVSLDNRGDGIKARHIPLILKFIAKEKKKTQVQGAAQFTFVWAYEEPENSVEMSRCFSLADEFFSYVEDNIAQVLMTTHSPVFYNLSNKNNAEKPLVTLHHIALDETDAGSQLIKNEEDLDDRMGITQLIAPYLRDEEVKWNKRQQLKNQSSQIKKPTVFVEGKSDKIILDKAFELFAGHIASKASIETEHRAGSEYVKNQLSGWKQIFHNIPTSEKKRAYGVFDRDDAGRKAVLSLEQEPRKKAKVTIKYATLPSPSHLKNLYDTEGMNIPIVLESFYPKSVWEHATKEEWLDKIDPPGFFEYFRVLQNKSCIQAMLGNDYHPTIDHDFKSEFKVKAAEYVAGHDDVKEFIAEFETLVQRISEFLFPDSKHPWQIK